MADKLRVSRLMHDSVVDGPGLRYVIFVQGCPHRCEGCHNPGTHAVGGGFEISVEEIIKDFGENPLLQGITISGGEPFCQIEPLIQVAGAARRMGLDVWIYTGYVFEEIPSGASELIGLANVIVDGPYVEKKRTLASPWIGSENQRVIDVAKTLKEGSVVPIKVN